VGADLATGFYRFAGRDAVAVAGVVASVQKEEAPAVMAAARRGRGNYYYFKHCFNWSK